MACVARVHDELQVQGKISSGEEAILSLIVIHPFNHDKLTNHYSDD